MPLYFGYFDTRNRSFKEEKEQIGKFKDQNAILITNQSGKEVCIDFFPIRVFTIIFHPIGFQSFNCETCLLFIYDVAIEQTFKNV